MSGIIQQGNDPRLVFVDLGKIEAVLPPQEQVPGENYVHGSRLKCHVVSVAKTPRGPRVTRLAHPPEPGQLAVRARGARDRRRLRRDRRRSPARPATAPRSRCARPSRASTRRAPASARWVSGSGPSWPSCTARRSTSSTGPTTPPSWWRNALSPAQVTSVTVVDRAQPLGARRRPRLPALARHRQGGPERPARRPPHRLADRHPGRHRPRPATTTSAAVPGRERRMSTRPEG